MSGSMTEWLGRDLQSLPFCGRVAEWLGNGLQNRLPRFKSGHDLRLV